MTKAAYDVHYTLKSRVCLEPGTHNAQRPAVPKIPATKGCYDPAQLRDL